MNLDEEIKDLLAVSGLLFVGLLLIIGSIWGLAALGNVYSVWSQGKEGEAELKKAEWSRQIQVREAEAKRDSSKLLAQAEIERAKGVAEANKIIGDSLNQNEAYLRYLWIDSIQHTQNQIIYLPTEAGLPVLEAKR